MNSLELELEDDVSYLLRGCWKLNPGPLQDQQLLLITKLSL